jgi:hypothetical protein
MDKRWATERHLPTERDKKRARRSPGRWRPPLLAAAAPLDHCSPACPHTANPKVLKALGGAVELVQRASLVLCVRFSYHLDLKHMHKLQQRFGKVARLRLRDPRLLPPLNLRTIALALAGQWGLSGTQKPGMGDRQGRSPVTKSTIRKNSDHKSSRLRGQNKHRRNDKRCFMSGIYLPSSLPWCEFRLAYNEEPRNSTVCVGGGNQQGIMIEPQADES